LEKDLKWGQSVWLLLEERPAGVSKKSLRPCTPGKIIEEISDIDLKI
jgi:hypothetical protein